MLLELGKGGEVSCMAGKHSTTELPTRANVFHNNIQVLNGRLPARLVDRFNRGGSMDEVGMSGTTYITHSHH